MRRILINIPLIALALLFSQSAVKAHPVKWETDNYTLSTAVGIRIGASAAADTQFALYNAFDYHIRYGLCIGGQFNLGIGRINGEATSLMFQFAPHIKYRFNSKKGISPHIVFAIPFGGQFAFGQKRSGSGFLFGVRPGFGVHYIFSETFAAGMDVVFEFAVLTGDSTGVKTTSSNFAMSIDLILGAIFKF